MELKTKYQYTYFVYPFFVKEKDYAKFITNMILGEKWQGKIFNKIDDIEIDTHFMGSAKTRMFPTLKWSLREKKDFAKSTNVKKAKVLSELSSCMLEYRFEDDVKGKIEDKNAIFFDISKIRLMCFKEGICFLLIKTELTDANYTDFKNLLNLNYKFRNVTPQFLRIKDYDYIKIQSNRFDTMEDIRKFINKVCIKYDETDMQDAYTNRMFVYSYACLDESEWNSTKDFKAIRDYFLKYKHVLSADYNSEFADNIEKDNTYTRWKYSMYGFTKMSGVLFSSATDHFNFTKLPEYYENVYLYIMLYAFYQRLSYVLLLKEIEDIKNKNVIKNKILKMAKNNALNQVSNSEHAMMLWQNWSKTFGLDDMYKSMIDCYNILS